MKELRYFNVSLRSDGGTSRRVFGRAAAYGTYSQDFGGWREIIQKGAFADVVKRGGDCYALFNHDPNKILGRTKSGTLQLRDTDGGLDFSLDLPDTPLGQEIGELCSRGDLNQCSFAFMPGEQQWDDEDYEDEETGVRSRIAVRKLRTIAKLQDISLVTYPAYAKGTSAQLMSRMFPQGIPESFKRHIVTPKSSERRRRELFKFVVS
jgi:uncharacterized protein